MTTYTTLSQSKIMKTAFSDSAVKYYECIIINKTTKILQQMFFYRQDSEAHARRFLLPLSDF